ncbi:hypothetical protein ACVXZ4_01495 [Lacisediminihabitans sp. FW035]
MTVTGHNPTRHLIDAMIDRAHDDNGLAGYIIVIGHAPLTSRASEDLAWLQGHKTYRRLPVAYSSSIPWEAVLLSPAADNYQVGEVIEYRGLIDSGRITSNTIYL